MKPYGVHWFRRDLRIEDNLALRHNFKAHQGRVLGVFCFDQKFLNRPDFGANRFGFFLKTLQTLQNQMSDLGGTLRVIDARAVDFFSQWLTQLPTQARPHLVTYGRDYEPFARQRDQECETVFQKFGVPTWTCRDHVLIEPHEILKDGPEPTPYKVYTPFSKRWFQKFESETIQNRIQEITLGKNLATKNGSIFAPVLTELEAISPLPPDALKTFIRANQKKETVIIPENVGFSSALGRTDEFKNKIDRYSAVRDIPILDGTSRLSIYFKNGSLTPGQVIKALGLSGPETAKDERSSFKFFKEIVWREFYISILHHFPHVEKSAFQNQYDAVAWQSNSASLERWKTGQTGFPIVDAGMRELNETGFMHNRVRMIVASFLTKDLLIDWREGERYFMEKLLDGDLAPNNGGWQWAASTGVDAQPYFRVFNPWLQSEKFDPDGLYIKKWVKELAQVPANAIHTEGTHLCTKGYPRPIVEHAIQKEKAIGLFKSLKKD